MSWLGKMIGGTIGFALGGPIGAIAGAAFGHTFDRREDIYLGESGGWANQGQARLSANEEAQLVFFTGAFSMLAKICKADGRVSAEEISAIEEFMRSELQLDSESQETAKNIFRKAIHSPDSFEDFARQFYLVFRSQPQITELMLDILFRVSLADGKISSREETLLRSAARIFQFSDGKFQKFASRYLPRAASRDYAILKLDETATDEEIRRQYRTLVNEYHPDKIQAKGLPEEFVKFANDKFIEVQKAYEQIRRERGF